MCSTPHPSWLLSVRFWGALEKPRAEQAAGTVAVTRSLESWSDLGLCLRCPGLQNNCHKSIVANGVAMGLNCNKNVI